MAKINDVKVWKNASKTETRVYVHTDDGREGVIYRTGNPWHPKNSREGNLTETEWNAAAEIAYYNNAWHTVWSSAAAATRCPDCGGNCGANCNSNRF